LSERNLQRIRYDFDISQSHVPFPALDTADVRAIQIASRGEFLLREAGSLPELADPVAESLGDVSLPRHWADT